MNWSSQAPKNIFSTEKRNFWFLRVCFSPVLRQYANALRDTESLEFVR